MYLLFLFACNKSLKGMNLNGSGLKWLHWHRKVHGGFAVTKPLDFRGKSPNTTHPYRENSRGSGPCPRYLPQTYFGDSVSSYIIECPSQLWSNSQLWERTLSAIAVLSACGQTTWPAPATEQSMDTPTASADTSTQATKRITNRGKQTQTCRE